jgi:hypothetical protein
MTAAAPATVQHIRTADGVSVALHRLGSRSGARHPRRRHLLQLELLARDPRHRLRPLPRRHGFEACVLDFRGHGASQRQAPGQRWTFDQWGRRTSPPQFAPSPPKAARPCSSATPPAAHPSSPPSPPSLTCVPPSLRPSSSPRRCHGCSAGAVPPHGSCASRQAASPHSRHGCSASAPRTSCPASWSSGWTGTSAATGSATTAPTTPSHSATCACRASSWPARATPLRTAARRARSLRPAPGRRRVLRPRRPRTGFRHDYDHVGIVVSRDARTEVWPLLLAFLQRHAGTAP